MGRNEQTHTRELSRYVYWLPVLNESGLTLTQHNELCLREFLCLAQHFQLWLQLIEVPGQLEFVLHVLLAIHHLPVKLINRHVQC